MNVPQLRFSGFDADIRELKLKEIATVLSGKRLPKGHSFKPSGIPYISVSDMGEVKVEKEKFSFIFPETEELIKKYKVSNGDIIISMAGTLGKVNLVDESLENTNLTDNCNKITVKESEDNKFVFYYLKSEIIQKKIQESSTTSSQPKLALDRLRNFEIGMPKLAKQQKVSSFFQLLSQKIERQKEKVEKLKQFKQGIIKKIFSQEWRFKNENGWEFSEWEETLFGEVITNKTEK